MREYRIAVIAGDGIGGEVVAEGIRAMHLAAEHHGFRCSFEGLPWGSEHYLSHGRMMPADAIERLSRFQAIYLGAVGHPKVPDYVTLNGLLLPIRRSFEQFANVRPARSLPGIETPLAEKDKRIDILLFRENTEGEYADVGGRVHAGGDAVAIQTAVFTRKGTERLIRFAFEEARQRRRRLVTSITKSNAQGHSMTLWDEVFAEVAADYPELRRSSLLVDAAAMELIRRPWEFDVIVASNLFGDILSEITATVTGSIGLAPSANLDPSRRHPSLFEPVHGSAPDIAGRGIANPVGAILSAAMMLAWLGEASAAESLERAVHEVLREGAVRTPDIGGSATTSALGEAIAARVRARGLNRSSRLALPPALAAVLWLWPPPSGVTPQAWHLFAIFAGTIVALMAKALPMGAVGLAGLTACVLTGTLTTADALAGFSNGVIWLIVASFFIARGFIKTGLGRRIAFVFVALLGRSSLGLAYGLIATDLVLAPAIPSNTARGGAVLFPILRGIAQASGSEPGPTARRLGSFLVLASFHGVVVTSAMFLTAMAANPMATRLAAEHGIAISWTSWALAASVPGLASLLIVPALLYWLHTPEIRRTPEARQLARSELRALGPVGRDEWIMLLTFALLLVLWMLGEGLFGIDGTATAFAGVTLLLVAGVVTWQDLLEEHAAWDTLVWFAALLTMATQLNRLGLIARVAEGVSRLARGHTGEAALVLIALAYFYSHYGFASNVAHVSSMYAVLLAAALGAGAPPLLSALLLGFFGNLSGALTHYGTGPAPVFFGSGYVELTTWWRIGLIVSLAQLAIWLGLGWPWWGALGLR